MLYLIVEITITPQGLLVFEDRRRLSDVRARPGRSPEGATTSVNWLTSGKFCITDEGFAFRDPRNATPGAICRPSLPPCACV
jgi:hypothetical protein